MGMGIDQRLLVPLLLVCGLVLVGREQAPAVAHNFMLARFSLADFQLASPAMSPVFWESNSIPFALLLVLAIVANTVLWVLLVRQKVTARTRELEAAIEAKRKVQRFEEARNQVLEAILRNAPPPESMEGLALAVEERIEGSLCAIVMAPDGQAFLNGKPCTLLIAPKFPEPLQQEVLPMLSSVFADPKGAAVPVPRKEDLTRAVLEAANRAGLLLGSGELTVVLSGTGQLSGLVLLFFEDTPPPDREDTARISRAASRLASLAADHWRMHEQLIFDARHDKLTGLLNRAFAEDRLEQALARAQRHKQMFAVLCIDLDGFKAVNDTLGHHAGDELLRVVATRLRERIRQSDTLARIGGDEFLAVVENCSGHSSANSVALSLIAALQEPIHFEYRSVPISGSIGVAMFPADGRTATELHRSADQAMYRAKAAGKGQVCFWAAGPLAAGESAESFSASR